MQEVVTQLSEKLVLMGHDVTVATSFDFNRKVSLLNGVKIVDFNIEGNFVIGIKGEIDKYQDFLKSEDFDIITNFAAQQWATDLMLPLLSELRAKKIFVPTGFSGFYLPKFSDYYKQMQKWIVNYDANVFLSYDYRDITFAKKYNAKNIVLIPNGADKEEFESSILDKSKLFDKLNIPKNSFVIITIGSHTGLKGHGDAIKIFKKLKLKNVYLCIVGNSKRITFNYFIKSITKSILSLFISKIKLDCYLSCKINSLIYNSSISSIKNKKKILNLNLSREETISLYKSADLFLFPSNIECSPIVLFECGAASLPFLTSDVGNSKEIIDWTRGGELMKTSKDKQGNSYVDINEASNQLLKLIKDPFARKEYGENGYKSHISTYNWDSIAFKYEELYKTLIN